MDRRRSWLVLLLTAFMAVVGLGRPATGSAASPGGRVEIVDVPSNPLARRAFVDPTAHAPKGDAREGDGAAPPAAGLELGLASSSAIAEPWSVIARPIAKRLRHAALPRGPPSFVC